MNFVVVNCSQISNSSKVLWVLKSIRSKIEKLVL